MCHGAVTRMLYPRIYHPRNLNPQVTMPVTVKTILPGHSGPTHYIYNPKEDITAYEIALIVPVLIKAQGESFGPERIGREGNMNAIEALPERAKRHFDFHDSTKIS